MGEAEKGPYVLRHGDVWYKDVTAPAGRAGPERRVCGPHDTLAIVYDSEEGVVHKHGPENLVRAYADKIRAGMAKAGFEELTDNMVMLSFPPVPEALDRLNDCLATTGLVMRLPEMLGDIAERNPELAQAPSYPR